MNKSIDSPSLIIQIFTPFIVLRLALTLMLATPAKAEPAMWVIKDNDSTIYLIGTVHLLRHETEWNATKVKKAVAESTQLWLEATDVDDLAKVAPAMAQYGVDMEHPLSSKLNATQKQKLASVAETYSLPLETLESMKPWMAAMLCTVLPLQKAGFDPSSGVDLVLKAQATKEGDQIFGFETAEEQIRFFAELSEADQIAFLDQTLTDVAKGISELDKVAKAWVDGDVETIGKLLDTEFKKDAPALYQKLLVQRNIAWADKIVKILKGSGVQQIAVGAAHLAGPDSLQVQLAKRGIKVERY